MSFPPFILKAILQTVIACNYKVFLLISDENSQGAQSVLHKYITLLNKPLIRVVNLAVGLASHSPRHFHVVAAILKQDAVG